MNYYRVSEQNQGADGLSAVICAVSREEAVAKFIGTQYEPDERPETPEQYGIYVEEVPLETLIAEEMEMLRSRITWKYMADTYGDISVGEFAIRSKDPQERDRMFYEGLQTALKRFRMSEYLEKRLDLTKLTYAEFSEICSALCAAKAREELEKIHIAAIEKYGKEVAYQ